MDVGKYTKDEDEIPDEPSAWPSLPPSFGAYPDDDATPQATLDDMTLDGAIPEDGHTYMIHMIQQLLNKLKIVQLRTGSQPTAQDAQPMLPQLPL